MPKDARPLRRITRAAVKLLAGTLASRALGLVRVLLIARLFGGRALVDVFNIAFMIPNLFRRALAEQAIESAFLPTFRSLTTQGRVREAWRAASAVLNWLLVLLVVAAAVCWIIAPALVSGLLAPGFTPERSADAAHLGRLMCPFVVLIGVAAFLGSLLLAHGQTWAYGLAPTLFNAGWIATMVLLHRRLGVYSLVLGVVVGGALQLLASAVLLALGRRRGLVRGGWQVSVGFADPAAYQVLQLAGPVCTAALIDRLASVVDRAVASFLEVGSVAALGYAMQLVLAPYAFFALSVGRAALVPLSERAASNDWEGFRRALIWALLLGLLVLVPVSAAAALLAHPIAWLLQGGKFGPEETRMAAAALRWYAFGLPGMGLVSILSRALHAMKDTRSPLRAARWALYANVLLSALLALTPMKHAGIALATSIAMTLQAAVLFISLRTTLWPRSSEPAQSPR
ncbi:MAG: murein biosynthesis integral membrane protein MurJ [Planctomycetota bacterium]